MLHVKAIYWAYIDNIRITAMRLRTIPLFVVKSLHSTIDNFVAIVEEVHSKASVK